MALFEHKINSYTIRLSKKVNISEFLKIHAYKNEGFYSICKRLLQHLKDEQSLKRMHTYIDIFQNK